MHVYQNYITNYCNLTTIEVEKSCLTKLYFFYTNFPNKPFDLDEFFDFV